MGRRSVHVQHVGKNSQRTEFDFTPVVCDICDSREGAISGLGGIDY